MKTYIRQRGGGFTVVVEFDANDRCDRCPAQAKAVAHTTFGDLLFCQHHINQFRTALEAAGIDIQYEAIPGFHTQVD